MDAIVINAGGWGAFLVDYVHLLTDEPEWYERAKNFVSHIKDISDILIECGFLDNYSLSLPKQIVTFQEVCCGAAGIYNLLQEEMATSLIDFLLKSVRIEESTFI